MGATTTGGPRVRTAGGGATVEGLLDVSGNTWAGAPGAAGWPAAPAAAGWPAAPAGAVAGDGVPRWAVATHSPTPRAAIAAAAPRVGRRRMAMTLPTLLGLYAHPGRQVKSPLRKA
jgi:hypothetical protein